MQTVALPLRQRTGTQSFYLKMKLFSTRFGRIRECFWWGGRAVECAGFENLYGRNVIASSNLAPTAMFQSPTHGQVDMEKLRRIVSSYMAENKQAKYEIIVGTDSQKLDRGGYDFVSALVIHRLGAGGIYFWKREVNDKKMGLKERIYREASMSLETSENFVTLFKTNGISRYDIQIHVDIGPNGETREMINEISGMIRGSGYEVKIKPYSYGASKVADRYT